MGVFQRKVPFGRIGEEPIGLVLSGGGAKGVYQAGVWKAMAELGLTDRVRAISGTSIGAINAAAFAALGSPASVERFWMESVDSAADVRPGLLTLYSLGITGYRILRGEKFPLPSLLDRKGLERMLLERLPEVWPANGPAVYATALECRIRLWGPWGRRGYKLRRFRVDREPNSEKRVRFLLASSAIPWGFPPVKIDGASFVDGGWEARGGENTPLAPILDNHPDLRTIVVVRLNTGVDDPVPLTRPPRIRAKIIEIRPSKTLPGPLANVDEALEALDTRRDSTIRRNIRTWSGVIAFDPVYARHSFDLGYADARAMLELTN